MSPGEPVKIFGKSFTLRSRFNWIGFLVNITIYNLITIFAIPFIRQIYKADPLRAVFNIFYFGYWFSNGNYYSESLSGFSSDIGSLPLASMIAMISLVVIFGLILPTILFFVKVNHYKPPFKIKLRINIAGILLALINGTLGIMLIIYIRIFKLTIIPIFLTEPITFTVGFYISLIFVISYFILALIRTGFMIKEYLKLKSTNQSTVSE